MTNYSNIASLIWIALLALSFRYARNRQAQLVHFSTSKIDDWLIFFVFVTDDFKL